MAPPSNMVVSTPGVGVTPAPSILMPNGFGSPNKPLVRGGCVKSHPMVKVSDGDPGVGLLGGQLLGKN